MEEELREALEAASEDGVLVGLERIEMGDAEELGFVAGVGTGGTIGGVARYLKEKDPSIHVVGVDPQGSIFSEYWKSRTLVEPGPYLLEGLGDETPIDCVEFDLIDDFFQIQDAQAFACARELASREAIFAGALTLAILVVTEIIPKTLGARFAVPLAGPVFAEVLRRFLTPRFRRYLGEEAAA